MQGGDAEGLLMTIGAVRAATGLSERQIRYLERLGLLATSRSPGGQRRYTLAEVEKGQRIAALRRRGQSLAQIRRALASPPLPDGEEAPAPPQPDFGQLTDARIYFNLRRGERG